MTSDRIRTGRWLLVALFLAIALLHLTSDRGTLGAMNVVAAGGDVACSAICDSPTAATASPLLADDVPTTMPVLAVVLLVLVILARRIVLPRPPSLTVLSVSRT